MKRRIIALICASVIAAGTGLCLLCGNRRSTEPEEKYTEASVFTNVLFIGDSLTKGAYWYADDSGELASTQTKKSFPFYFCRFCGADYANLGVSGIQAKEWYDTKRPDSYRDYDLVIIWLGTNDGYTVSQFENGVLPYSDPDDYSDDPTGAYCRIIAELRRDNPNAHVVLCTVFVGGCFNGDSTAESTNETICRIGEHYGCQVCDLSWLKLTETTPYHAQVNNIHLGVYGNFKLAEYLYQEIGRAVHNDYTIAERAFRIPSETPDAEQTALMGSEE